MRLAFERRQAARPTAHNGIVPLRPAKIFLIASCEGTLLTLLKPKYLTVALDVLWFGSVYSSGAAGLSTG